MTKKTEKSKGKHKENKIEEYVNDIKRLQAEFENFSKRTEKEKQELVKFANANLLLKLINFKDDFDRAISAADAAKKTNSKELLEGIGMMQKQFAKLLKEEGVKEIEAQGKKFDHNFHEAIMQKQSEKEEGTILEEVQKGYVCHGKVLRTSKVIISG